MENDPLLRRDNIGHDWIEGSAATNEPAIETSKESSKDFIRAGMRTPFLVSLEHIRQRLEIETLPRELISKLVAATKQVGGWLSASESQLSFVPLRELPKRIEPIRSESFPSLSTLASSDAVELDLVSHELYRHDDVSFQRLNPVWPLDVSSLDTLGKRFGLLRELVEDSIPLGLNLPITGTTTSFEAITWLADLPLNFVTFRTPSSVLPASHEGLSLFDCEVEKVAERARRLLDRIGQTRTRVGIDTTWLNGYQAYQATRAGCDYVCLDSFLGIGTRSSSMTSSSQGSSSMLASLGYLDGQAARMARLLKDWDVADIVSRFASQFHALREITG